MEDDDIHERDAAIPAYRPKTPQTPDSAYYRKRKMPLADKIWLGLMAVGAWGAILALLFGSGWR